MDWLTSVPVAHRGLHNEQAGIIENSASAFAAAVAAGYGIECDIQLSSDGEAMVYHDANLNRLTAASGPLRGRPAKEIGALTLTGSQDRIQTLGELLEQVDGKVPLLIEIKKKEGQTHKLEERTKSLLEDYKGPAAIMCFSPGTVSWFRENAPGIVRGQLSGGFPRRPGHNRPALQRFAARHLLINWYSRPHFVGYNIGFLPAIGPSLVRKMGTPILTWTVRTQRDRRVAKTEADNIIFEGFKPPLDWTTPCE